MGIQAPKGDPLGHRCLMNLWKTGLWVVALNRPHIVLGVAWLGGYCFIAPTYPIRPPKTDCFYLVSYVLPYVPILVLAAARAQSLPVLCMRLATSSWFLRGKFSGNPTKQPHGVTSRKGFFTSRNDSHGIIKLPMCGLLRPRNEGASILQTASKHHPLTSDEYDIGQSSLPS